MCGHRPRLYGKSVADTHLEGWICHAFVMFSCWMFTKKTLRETEESSELLCKTELLHEGLWLWIVTTEVAVDHCLVLCTTHLEDVLAE